MPEIHKKHSCFQEAGVNELALKKLLNGTKKKAGGWSCLNPGKKPPPSFVQNIRHPKRRELSRPNNERSLSGRHCISVFSKPRATRCNAALPKGIQTAGVARFLVW